MPHIRPSVSHSPGDRGEIYLPEPLDGLLEPGVAQPHAQRSATLGHGAHAPRRHAQLLRQRRHDRRPLRSARHNGSAARSTRGGSPPTTPYAASHSCEPPSSARVSPSTTTASPAARAWLGTARSARESRPIIPITGVGSTAPAGLSL